MQTIPVFFEQQVSIFPDNILLWEKKTNTFEGVTYSQVREEALKFAAGLIAMGVEQGDRIALLSEGCNAWVISELGVLYSGAINVPLSVKLNEPNELIFRLRHAGVKIVIASHNQVAKIRDIFDDISSLSHVIVFSDETKSENEITFAQVVEMGIKLLSEDSNVVECRYKLIKPTDIANICYTSGTTADPKGIMLSHNNYISNVFQSYTLMDIPSHYITFLILPWDHAFAHTVGIYCMMGKGASLASVQLGKTGIETLKNIPINIKEIKPNLMMSVPALASNFRSNIEKGIKEKGTVINALFKHALKISYSYNGDGYHKGKGLTWCYKPLIKIYDKLIFSKIRENFGGRLDFFIGGGALLDVEIQRFFYAIGLPMFQGYGLTEASPVISSNSLTCHKLGSSGYLVQNMELKIVDANDHVLPAGEQGEIVIKGENVMLGYWDNPEATAQTIRDGWLYTGDLGYMDNDGFLYVKGRFKSLLISNDGEKYSPEGIEEAFINQSNYISQCMMYNNQKPYSILLLVPNKQALLVHLTNNNLDAYSQEGVLEALKYIHSDLQQHIHHGSFSKMFPMRWLPTAIGVLPEAFTEENHTLNSTMKMVRGKITERYSQLIDYLYTAEGKDMFNEHNVANMRKFLS